MDVINGTLVLEDTQTGNHWDFENKVWYNVIDNNLLIERALQIDLEYTTLISDLLRKHIEKKLIENIEIPQEVLDERDRLRNECNQKILDLGVNDFNYRQQILKL